MSVRMLPILLLITAAMAPPGTQAATTGSLKFAGQINAGTCNLAAGDVNRTIALPAVKVSDFDSTLIAGAFDFEIQAECESDLRNVTFRFTGTPDPISTWRFANTGTAEGIALWLYSRIGGVEETIRANGTNNTRTIAVSSSRAVLPLGAAYFKTKAVSHGSLASTATVSITYN